MLLNREDNKSLLVVAFVVLLTRIPFLFAGFGSEEDAWGLILIARNINLSGIYENLCMIRCLQRCDCTFLGLCPEV